ncbi:MAG: EamA family transporter RarD [Anaerolineales bacterium]|jgi:chloramphenicol-sensitive protein RarD
MKKGVLYGIGAYLLWGIFPIYWKLLEAVPAIQIISHRIIWSFVLLALILFITRQWRSFRAAALSRRVVLIYLVSAILLSINWLTYIWAINAGFVLETSLGYFINPLLSVLLGVLFVREKLRPLQWLPIGLAAIGVIYVAVSYGQFPWIALTLAISFGLYGLVKKVAPLGSLFGLTLETGLLFLPAVAFLIILEWQGQGAFLHVPAVSNLLMIGAGLVTTVPLLLFASAAQRIPLSTLGILQYINPTIAFLLGLFLFHEPFNLSLLIGFSIVWLALIIYWGENFLATRKARSLPTIS